MRARAGLVRTAGVAFVAACLVVGTVAPAAAALPSFDVPALSLVRTIQTTPFVNDSTKSVKDLEGSAFVPSDNSLWLADDNGNELVEIDPTNGFFKRRRDRTALSAAPRYGDPTAPLAGDSRDGDLESMAYDPTHDVLYAFSGNCCTSTELPTAFRLVRGSTGTFVVDSYQPLALTDDFTAAAARPDGALYVGKGADIWPYDYATNAVGTPFQITGLSGILGLSFSDDGADLFAVTTSATLVRVDWATKSIVPNWTFDLTPFDTTMDSRAVELINGQFYVADGYDFRSAGDLLNHAVYVFDIVDATQPPIASFTASPTSGVAPLGVSFTDTSTGGTPTHWSWDFGDGNGSTAQNPTHIYTQPGTYTVALTASNSGGGNTSTQTDLVHVAQGLTAAADSYVNKGKATKSFGAATTLKGKTGKGELRPYAMFDVTGLAATPTSVKLRLWVTKGSSSTGTLYQTATTWSEGTLTWNNAPPPLGSAVAAARNAPIGTWVEFDVTGVVTGNGTYSFVLVPTVAQEVDFSSRQGVHAPQLAIS